MCEVEKWRKIKRWAIVKKKGDGYWENKLQVKMVMRKGKPRIEERSGVGLTNLGKNNVFV